MQHPREYMTKHETREGKLGRIQGIFETGFKSVRHMKAYKKQQASLQQSGNEVRKGVAWGSCESSPPQSSEMSQGRIRSRSASLGRLYDQGHSDTAEEPREFPSQLVLCTLVSFLNSSIITT